MGFRNMKVFIALACLAAVASAGLVTKKSLAKIAKPCGPPYNGCPKTTCGPDETECPAGCCPEANWFCCPDNRFVLPLLMTAHPSNCPIYSQKRLQSPVAHLTMDAQRPPVAQMKLNAQLDVAQKLTGSAALTTDIVPLLLMTAHPSNCPIYSQKRLQSPVAHLTMDAQRPPVVQMKLN